MSDRVGNVSRMRYQELVAKAHELIAQVTKAYFALGDKALIIEPMRMRAYRCPLQPPRLGALPRNPPRPAMVLPVPS